MAGEACITGGMHDRGACVVGGACMTGVCVAGGRAWQEVHGMHDPGKYYEIQSIGERAWWAGRYYGYGIRSMSGW